MSFLLVSRPTSLGPRSDGLAGSSLARVLLGIFSELFVLAESNGGSRSDEIYVKNALFKAFGKILRLKSAKSGGTGEQELLIIE